MNKVEYYRKRIIHQAKDYGKRTECPDCGKKNWNVVPLHEYGDPYMPSSVILKCNECSGHITFAKADTESAKTFAKNLKEQQKKEKDMGFQRLPKDDVDKIIGGPKS